MNEVNFKDRKTIEQVEDKVVEINYTKKQKIY